MSGNVATPLFWLLPGVLFILSFGYLYLLLYRYGKVLRLNHPGLWVELMDTDPYAKATGDWTRFPTGSNAVVFSLFKLNDDYGDVVVRAFKRKARIAFVLMVTSFTVMILANAFL